jgi:hypothetical protein
MMEPIALGKATIVGPAVDDFRDTVQSLLLGDGIVQTTAERLSHVLVKLLANSARRQQLASNGRGIIRAHQGATEKTASIIMTMLSNSFNRTSDTASKSEPAVAAGGRDGGGGERRKAGKQSTVVVDDLSI